MIRDYFRHLITSFLIVCFFNTSSVSAAIDFDSPCYSTPENQYYYQHGGQCTAFAWGRTCEKTGIKLVFKNDKPPSNPPYPHAKYWYLEGPIDSLNLQLGSDIRPNSIAIWEENKEVSYGHVAYVERVEDGIVYFNEANWDTYCGATCNWWGGGYDGHDGYEKSSPVDDFEHRDAKDGIRYDILGYLYLTPPLPQDHSLVRIQGQDPVYWLQNGKAYHVLNMDIINNMSGLSGWGSDQIYEYPADALEIVPPETSPAEGIFVQAPDFISTGSGSNDLLIKLPDDPKIYLIENGQRRWITSEDVFNEQGYDWNDIITVTPSILALIPEGDPIYLSQPDFYLLSGTLTDADGNPLRGWIYANETSGANLGNHVYSSDGTYEMALFPGTYRVYAQVYNSYPGGYYYFRTPYETLTINANATLNITVPSYELYHLTGKVTDANGVGLPNISVRAYNSNNVYQSYATTNSDGTYDALVTPGTYYLYFVPPANSGFIQKYLYNIPIYNDYYQEVFLDSQEQYTLSGTLTDANGNPLRGYIYANKIGGSYHYNSAYSPDGTYEMNLFLGTYRVYARTYNYYSGGSTYISTPYQNLTINTNTTFNIVAPSYNLFSLSGKITDINNVAQANVNIYAYNNNGICWGYARTDANGDYNLSLIPGTYRLRITAPPATYPPFEIQNLQISGDSVRNIRLSLEYTILDEAIAQLLANLELSLDVFDIINQEETLNYDVIIQGIKDLLQIILNWQGSEMKITLYDPNGNIYGEYQSANPPINIEIPNPTAGTWSCEVTAADVPHDNYPFALVVGISPNQAPVADANGPYSGTVDTPITFDAGDSYDPDGEIATYEWDWDGDGVYDQSSNSATINHTWTEPYSGTIYLRVKDGEGATDTDNTSVEVTAAQEVPCDLDGDGDVDYDDYLLFRPAYGSCEGDANFLPAADLDKDGCITINDYRILRTLMQTIKKQKRRYIKCEGLFYLFSALLYFWH